MRYECELRFFIDDRETFEKELIEKHQAKLVFSYSFTDHYYQPKDHLWNPQEKNLRIRVWKGKKRVTRVFFTQNEIINEKGICFKRALLPEGKVSLFSGPIEECHQLVQAMGYEPWMVVEKKNAKVWSLPGKDVRFPIEQIDGLGATGEIECTGEDPKNARRKIEKSLSHLGIPLSRTTGLSISALLAKKTFS